MNLYLKQALKSKWFIDIKKMDNDPKDLKENGLHCEAIINFKGHNHLKIVVDLWYCASKKDIKLSTWKNKPKNCTDDHAKYALAFWVNHAQAIVIKEIQKMQKEAEEEARKSYQKTWSRLTESEKKDPRFLEFFAAELTRLNKNASLKLTFDLDSEYNLLVEFS